MDRMDVLGIEDHQVVVDFLENWERMGHQECQDQWVLWASQVNQG